MGRFLFRTAVAFLCITYFGMLWGILLAIVVSVVLDFLESFFRIRKELYMKQLREDNVLLTVEPIHNCDQLMFILRNVTENKHLTQTTSTDELAEYICNTFKGKNVFVQKGEDMEQLFTAEENV